MIPFFFGTFEIQTKTGFPEFLKDLKLFNVRPKDLHLNAKLAREWFWSQWLDGCKIPI